MTRMSVLPSGPSRYISSIFSRLILQLMVAVSAPCQCKDARDGVRALHRAGDAPRSWSAIIIANFITFRRIFCEMRLHVE